jgi:citrate synthase
MTDMRVRRMKPYVEKLYQQFKASASTKMYEKITETEKETSNEQVRNSKNQRFYTVQKRV